MTEATTANKQGGLLEDSTFNVIAQIEKKADFLHSAVENYVRDAERTTSQSSSSCGTP